MLSNSHVVHTQHLADNGRWGAWVREPKLGGTNSWIFLGSHLTQRLAARCGDRALLKLETDRTTMSMPMKLTFKREDYEEDEQLRKTLSRDEFFNLLREESCESNNDYQNWSTTTCEIFDYVPIIGLSKFLAQEKTLGNLSIIVLEGPFFDIDLSD